MRIGITGTGGFVGSHLLRELAGEHEVHALTRHPEADRELDLVIHAGGLIGGAHAREAYFEANAAGAEAVARAAVAMGAKRMVLLSTGAAKDPQGDYAESKRAGEEAVRQLMPTQILRLYFPYGPGQQPERLIPRLIDRIRNGDPVTEGPRLTPIYIDDLVEIVRRVVGLDGELLAEVGGPEVVSIGDIADRIGALLQVTPTILPPPAPVRDWIADLEPLIAATGYRPAVGVTEGLRRLIAENR